MIPLRKEENKSYRKQKVCMQKKLSTDNQYNEIASSKKYKARDYCHYTGKYRGAVHNISKVY